VPPEWLDVEGVLHWGRISMLKAGVRHADAVTTVSPTYAREIRTEALGFGMDGMMRLRGDSLHGILNGIDTSIWDPRTDPLIAQRYAAADLRGKAACKAALQAELGLAGGDDTLLFGFVGRLTEQKGIDLVLAEVEALVAAGGTLAVLGSGDAALERQALAAAGAHPGRVAVRLGFDEGLAHRIEAGADCFLMPSRFEPCGLNQMYSLAYGTPPLVHATGGLADTVRDAGDREAGNGFVIREATALALGEALARARAAFEDRAGWRALQRRAMAGCFDWSRSAAAYVTLYRQLVAAGSPRR
jgi:starch synthase